MAAALFHQQANQVKLMQLPAQQWHTMVCVAEDQ